MLKIRLQRYGKKGAAVYRIAVIPKTSKRDGKPVELLGFYNPRSKELVLNVARAAYWQSVGAEPSDTVASLLRREPTHNLESGPYRFQAQPRAAKLEALANIKKRSIKIGKAERQRKEAKAAEEAKREAEAAKAAEEAAKAAETAASAEVPAEQSA